MPGQSHSMMRGITLADLQKSRIHRAILLIAGRGTRWPKRLVAECDVLLHTWAELFGPVELIRPLLYERGGRLYEMREEKDLSRHVGHEFYLCVTITDCSAKGAHGEMAE